MKILSVALVVGLLVGGCAAGAPLTKAGGDLVTFTRADVQAALGIAIAANDPAGAACATAILAALPESAVALATPQGALSAFMLARETRRKITAGVSESVHIACAPLILDAEATLAKLGLMAVPGGGALGGLLK